MAAASSAAAVFTLLTLGAGTALANAPTAIEVRLGTHTFNALTPPDALVAQVGADGVGWVQGLEVPSYGPWSFEISTEGVIWLLDQVNNRLLGWWAGRQDRIVPLPTGVADFATGPNGTFYVSTHPAGEPMRLAAVAADGRVLWRAALASQIFNNNLRMGPDGVLYDVEHGEPTTWFPVVGADGSPLSVTEQNRLARPYQPLPGGNRLIVTYVSDHETRVAVHDGTGQPTHSWRITSDTGIAPTIDVPAFVGGDPVVTLDVFDRTGPAQTYRMEQIVLRLSDSGGRPVLHVDNAYFGESPVTEYRVGPDGAFHQLQTSRDMGVKIVRFNLGVPVPPPTTTPSAPASTPMTTATAGPGAAAPTATAAPPSRPTYWRWLIWTSATMLATAILGAGILVRRNRRRPRPGDTPTDEPDRGARPGVPSRN
jgi:hypothetical protein